MSLPRGTNVGPDGRPRQRGDVLTPKQVENEARLEGMVAEGLAIEGKLKGEDGQFFVSLLEKLLEGDIDRMIQADPRAKAILDIARDLGSKITAGRMAQARLDTIRTKRQGGLQII